MKFELPSLFRIFWMDPKASFFSATLLTLFTSKGQLCHSNSFAHLEPHDQSGKTLRSKHLQNTNLLWKSAGEKNGGKEHEKKNLMTFNKQIACNIPSDPILLSCTHRHTSFYGLNICKLQKAIKTVCLFFFNILAVFFFRVQKHIQSSLAANMKKFEI